MWNDKNDGGLELTDISILEQYKDLRRRGLGKRMLMRFIEQAKREGAVYIEGFAKSHDGEKMDYILEWYKRQGFKVSGRRILLKIK
jgi:ribosomal protein S18 acetylase RimI-like enzyme